MILLHGVQSICLVLKTDMHVMCTDVPMATGVVIAYCNSQSPVQSMLDNYTQSIKHA